MQVKICRPLQTPILCNMSVNSYEDILNRIAKGVENFTYKPQPNGQLSPDLHNMRMRLQYPELAFSEIPDIEAMQSDIIDGLQAFISIYRPEGFRKFSVERNAYLYMKERVGPSRGYVTRYGAIDPEDYSSHNLNSEVGQQSLLRDTRIYFDRMDPINPVMVAMWAKAWAKKLYCDKKRRDAIVGTLRATQGDFDSGDIRVAEFKGRKQLPLDVGDIFKLSKTDTEHMVDIESSGQTFLSQCGSFLYWANNDPAVLCDALNRFADLSLGLTLKRYKTLLGDKVPPPPNNPNAKLPHLDISDFFSYLYDPGDYTRTESEMHNPVSVYALAAFFQCPGLLPYSRDYHQGAREEDFILKPIAFSHFTFKNYDANSLYDLVTLSGKLSERPRATWHAERHEYACKNYLSATEKMALDYLYTKGACHGHATYLGDANRLYNPDTLLNNALNICDGFLQYQLHKAKAQGIFIGEIPHPRETPYPTVALEEAVRQFHLHDPTVLSGIYRSDMSKHDMQQYLFLTQPSILKITDGLLTRDNEIRANIEKSLEDFLPTFLYEAQKSLCLMPKEYSRCVTDRTYVYASPEERRAYEEYAMPNNNQFPHADIER